MALRKSLELKAKAEESYKKGKVLLASIGEREPTADERAEVDKFAADMDTFLADANRHERFELADMGRQSAGIDPLAFTETDIETRKKSAKVYRSLGDQMRDIYAMATNSPQAGMTLEETRNKLNAAAIGQGEVIDSEGGFAVQADFASGIEKRMYETGKILGLVAPNAITISSASNRLVERFIDETSRATGSRWGAVRAYWIDEGDNITASKIKFDQMKTELEKIAALGYASSELLQDSSAMSGLFNEAFSDELTFMTEDAIFEGDGQGKPLGISIAPCLISIAKETNQAAATIVPQNLAKMWQRCPTFSKSTAVWLVHSECSLQLGELALPVGTGALQPRFIGYSQDGTISIYGRPVIEIEYASALGTVGDITLADFKQYRFINKGGVDQQQSIHVRFVNDEVAFRATYRVGGQPKYKKAITPFKGTNTISPFLQLATRS